MSAYGKTRHRETIRQKVDRELRDRCIAATWHCKRQPSRRWYDLRYGQGRWWGSMVRGIEEAVEAGAPADKVLAIPMTLYRFAVDCLADRGVVLSDDPPDRGAPGARVRKVA